MGFFIRYLVPGVAVYVLSKSVFGGGLHKPPQIEKPLRKKLVRASIVAWVIFFFLVFGLRGWKRILTYFIESHHLEVYFCCVRSPCFVVILEKK